jgi:hypothetical protein
LSCLSRGRRGKWCARSECDEYGVGEIFHGEESVSGVGSGSVAGTILGILGFLRR